MKMTLHRAHRFVRILGLSLGLGGLISALPAIAAADIKKLKGPDECGECHKKEVEAWRVTRHYKTFNELSRTKEAKKIGKSHNFIFR